ncbi:MAG TPA: GNAT family N-acetyltransferase [Methanoculleus sp.]|mgnify:FL=1|jgi:GNAT superfamily N-acetyltransferase|uniref:GNAT family N-acetyltransferase n=1 Tax=Methanoculleus sp. TaxID=90427 RepID=UPI002C099E59|nr:GNAT family N-acetyltransferase [Methanoculleus sp.]HOD85768.1 GNAT family N-acetyltransferase [Methanoculleus sp.]HOZ44259.1 GNAT family N-acetyltransferase [Methanoculleus sp.]HQL60348.1 GNAT family N-acetyltransferase [Methanoculleus sp.]
MPLPEIRFLPLSRDLDVSTFSCGHDDLDEFLIEDSMDYQRERLSVTRLAYIDSEIVGFFTLVTDCIDVKQVDPENGRRGYPYRKYPAIKVARLATSKKHQGNGIGSRMLHEILTLTIMISEYVGCRIITVDAKPESVGFYERFGFKRVKSRRSDPIPMYMDYYRALEEERPPG